MLSAYGWGEMLEEVEQIGREVGVEVDASFRMGGS